MTVRILKGDCRSVLGTLPTESVHCVVTSPPYWGLRDYGVSPSVWGGDGDCEHEWGATVVERAEQEAILETYMHALGMLADLPLGQAAIEKATTHA